MLRIALLGCGRIGVMHAANIASHKRAELAGVFDIRAEKQALLTDIRDMKDISKNGKDGGKIEDAIKSTLEAFTKTFA